MTVFPFKFRECQQIILNINFGNFFQEPNTVPLSINFLKLFGIFESLF